MGKRKFIYAFVAFDVLLIVGIVVYLLVANPFKESVAPSISGTTTTAVSGGDNNGQEMGPLSKDGEISREAMQVFGNEPAMYALTEESEKTSDGKYYTAYKGSIELDADGDGQSEYFCVNLDEHSGSFYFLVRKNGQAYDYVLKGKDYRFNQDYDAQVCKGEIRGFTTDLDPSDKYLEIGVVLMRDNWQEIETLVARFDGNEVKASRVKGLLSGSENGSGVQFYTYDTIYGVHKLYRTYSITNEKDFLVPGWEYFADPKVEQASFMHEPTMDIKCQNLKGDDVILSAGTKFFWCRTDNETFVDVLTTDGYVFRLPITAEKVEYPEGTQIVYHLGDQYAADLYQQ